MEEGACRESTGRLAAGGTGIAFALSVTKKLTIVGSGILALVVGALIFLRPKATGPERLAAPDSLPPAARQILRSKMARHGAQMQALVANVILLNDDGVARTAGAIFDEPALGRPVTGDELNGLLPERFFLLQDDVRARARRLVTASAHHDRAAIADEFAGLARSCVTCHQVYLLGDDAPVRTIDPRP